LPDIDVYGAFRSGFPLDAAPYRGVMTISFGAKQRWHVLRSEGDRNQPAPCPRAGSLDARGSAPAWSEARVLPHPPVHTRLLWKLWLRTRGRTALSTRHGTVSRVIPLSWLGTREVRPLDEAVATPGGLRHPFSSLRVCESSCWVLCRGLVEFRIRLLIASCVATCARTS